MTTCAVCKKIVSMYDLTKYVYRYSITNVPPKIYAVCKSCNWLDVPETNATEHRELELV
jgi:hypothetical protein